MELPANEAERLAALINYGILDSDFEQCFDDIVRQTALALDVPIALISLVDAKRQWFKAVIGLAVRETPRDVSFCTHAILGEDAMVVSDATEDQRFADNPLVVGEPGIRFYAGVPLVTSDGYALGTLCAIDRVPRQVSTSHLRALRDLAAAVLELMETRRARRAAARDRHSVSSTSL